MRQLFYPTSLVVAILHLEKLRRYRKWWGGHWELWCVDFPVCGDIWHDVKECSRVTKERPTGLCRGTPQCETY